MTALAFDQKWFNSNFKESISNPRSGTLITKVNAEFQNIKPWQVIRPSFD